MIKILLVDDNQNNRMALELILEDIEDISVSEAENGQIAVDMCKENFYDLIFMDIMMPVMDGIEATKQIQKINPHSMIIALSALDDKDSKHTMIKEGAQDYLTKPVDSELFLQRIKNYINIISLRKNQLSSNKEARNPFTEEIYDRLLTFYINKEESLVQFWDYFLQKNIFTCKNMSDIIRIVYGFSLWLLKENKKFSINIEESKNKLYIIIYKIDTIPKKVVQSIITKHIKDTLFILKEDMLAFELIKDETEIIEVNTERESITTNAETKEILSKTHDENLTAEEYVESTAIAILPKVDSLESIEYNLDELIIKFENHPNKENIEEVAQKFIEYYEVLSLLVQFRHLAFAVKSLIDFLQGLDGDKFKDKDLKSFASQLLNLVNDLTSWRESIFIKQDAINIHYLDASLLSSCLQIEALFEDKIVDEGDDLEFF